MFAFDGVFVATREVELVSCFADTPSGDSFILSSQLGAVHGYNYSPVSYEMSPDIYPAP